MKKSTLALAFAVVLAVLAVVAVRQYLSKEKKELEKGTQLSTILIASQPIPADTPVQNSWIEEFQVPQKCVLREMLFKKDRDRIVGLKSVRDIDRGRILLEPYFKEERATAPLTIEEGMRITTVGVNSVTGISGLITPGDFVDVIWTFKGGVGAGGTSTESTLTLFTQVVVFAVDDITTVGYRAARRGRGRGPVTPYTTVTLLLHPLECEILTFAKSQGEITLTKRSASDGSSPRSPGVDASHIDELINQARQKREGGR